MGQLSLLDRATAGSALIGGVLQVHDGFTMMTFAVSSPQVRKEGPKWAKNAKSHASGGG
jgi:hypothetical protein